MSFMAEGPKPVSNQKFQWWSECRLATMPLILTHLSHPPSMLLTARNRKLHWWLDWLLGSAGAAAKAGSYRLPAAAAAAATPKPTATASTRSATAAIAIIRTTAATATLIDAAWRHKERFLWLPLYPPPCPHQPCCGRVRASVAAPEPSRTPSRAGTGFRALALHISGP